MDGAAQAGISPKQQGRVADPIQLVMGRLRDFLERRRLDLSKTGESIDWFLPLWGVPFLIAGFYMIFGRFLHDAAIRKRLFYAVTDRRILVVRGLNSSKVKSLDIHRLPKLELSESGDGTGSIEFDGDSSFIGSGRNGFGLWTPALGIATQFFRIDDPRKVYDLVRSQPRA